jgi:hypothetical protein
MERRNTKFPITVLVKMIRTAVHTSRMRIAESFEVAARLWTESPLRVLTQKSSLIMHRTTQRNTCSGYSRSCWITADTASTRAITVMTETRIFTLGFTTNRPLTDGETSCYVVIGRKRPGLRRGLHGERL